MTGRIAGAVKPSGLCMIDKLVQALEEVYQIVDDDIGDVSPKVFNVIERVLDEFKSIYGKDVTNRS